MKRTTVFAGFDQVAAVGDLNGDKHNDLVARRISSGRLCVFRGDGTGAFRHVAVAGHWAR